jgi:hypothetical protein
MHRFFAIGAVVAVLAAAFCGTAGAWSWPAGGEVLRPFTLGADAYAAGQHRGIDVSGPDGSPVRAPASGVVTFAGSLPTYGRGVTILTDDGYSVTLVHLGAIGVSQGATVSEGDPVGTMGSSGTPEQAVPSVHLGIRHAADEQGYVDPLGLLPERPAAPVSVTEPSPAPEPVTPAVQVGASAPPPSSTPASPSSPPAAAPIAPVQPVVPTPAPPTAGTPQATPAAPTPTAAPALSQTRVAPPREPGVAITAGTVPAASGGDVLTDSRAAPVPPRPAQAPVFHVDAAPTAAPAVPVGSNTVGTAASPPPSMSREARLVSPASAGGAEPTGTRSDRSSRPHGASTTGDGVQRHASDTVALRASGRGRADLTLAAEGPNASGGRLQPKDAARVTRDGLSTAVPFVSDRALGGGTSAVRPSAVPRAPVLPVHEAATGGGPESPGAVALWRVALASALGLVLAAMVARRAARRIGGNGAVLPHHADLLRELDSAHRARVHDRGGGRLRTPPAAART